MHVPGTLIDPRSLVGPHPLVLSRLPSIIDDCGCFVCGCTDTRLRREYYKWNETEAHGMAKWQHLYIGIAVATVVGLLVVAASHPVVYTILRLIWQRTIDPVHRFFGDTRARHLSHRVSRQDSVNPPAYAMHDSIPAAGIQVHPTMLTVDFPPPLVPQPVPTVVYPPPALTHQPVSTQLPDCRHHCRAPPRRAESPTRVSSSNPYDEPMRGISGWTDLW